LEYPKDFEPAITSTPMEGNLSSPTSTDQHHQWMETPPDLLYIFAELLLLVKQFVGI
jgi:hypothetical protein